ncbi:MAG TPA: immunoglobulin domain-containing protein [Opitutaceae bacterium]|nr:immunoglobulin domain-containing protein [Opitutaceae bacterium]
MLRGRHLVLLALALCSAVRMSWGYVIDSRRWDAQSITLHLALDPAPLAKPLADGSLSWTVVAQAALTDWNQALGQTKFIAVPFSNAPVARANSVNTVTWSDTIFGEAWGAGVVAVTVTIKESGSSGRRVESDVIFNRAVNFDSYRGPYGSAVAALDFKRVALHEFGHVLGLDHPDDFGQSKTAVMNSFIGDIDRLQPDDVAGAQAAYGQGVTAVPPTISSLSGRSSAPAGSRVEFSVVAEGTAPFSYQWRKNGALIPGASRAEFVLEAAQLEDAGIYSVTVANAAGSVTASTGALKVQPSAPQIVTPPSDLTVKEGEAATLQVQATGSGPLLYQWTKDGVILTEVEGSSLILTRAARADVGRYAVRVSNAAGSVVSETAVVTVVAGVESRMTNLSVRTTLGSAAPLIVGMVVAGGEKPVVLRAIGPTLTGFGVPGAMEDPRLSFFQGSQRAGENDNWGGSKFMADTFASVGAFALPAASLDASLMPTVKGAATVQVSGSSGGTVLVEAYDAGNAQARLINLSARNYVGRGGDVLIAGFTISGTLPKTVLIRGIGPTLKTFGVAQTLADPKLDVYSAGRVIAENDTWSESLRTTFASVGAFELSSGSKDAALLLTLAPGSYTVQLSGADGGVGEGMIEVYDTSL